MHSPRIIPIITIIPLLFLQTTNYKFSLTTHNLDFNPPPPRPRLTASRKCTPPGRALSGFPGSSPPGHFPQSRPGLLRPDSLLLPQARRRLLLIRRGEAAESSCGCASIVRGFPHLARQLFRCFEPERKHDARHKDADNHVAICKRHLLLVVVSEETSHREAGGASKLP